MKLKHLFIFFLIVIKFIFPAEVELETELKENLLRTFSIQALIELDKDHYYVLRDVNTGTYYSPVNLHTILNEANYQTYLIDKNPQGNIIYHFSILGKSGTFELTETSNNAFIINHYTIEGAEITRSETQCCIIL